MSAKANAHREAWSHLKVEPEVWVKVSEEAKKWHERGELFGGKEDGGSEAPACGAEDADDFVENEEDSGDDEACDEAGWHAPVDDAEAAPDAEVPEVTHALVAKVQSSYMRLLCAGLLKKHFEDCRFRT